MFIIIIIIIILNTDTKCSFHITDAQQTISIIG